jgi:hypothetical protein
MSRQFMAWYNQASQTINKMRKATPMAYSDGEPADPCIFGYFGLWAYLACDLFGASRGLTDPTVWTEEMCRLVELYDHDIDELFADSKKIVKLLRLGASLSVLKQAFKGDRRVVKLFLFPRVPLRSVRTPQGFQAYHGFFNFLSKITLDHEGLEEAMFDEYMLREETIALRAAPVAEHQYVRLIQHFLSYWLSKWDESEIFVNAKFSSGSTARVGSDLADKVCQQVHAGERSPSPVGSSKIRPGEDSEWLQEGCRLTPIPYDLYDLIVEGSDWDPFWTSWFYPEYHCFESGRLSNLQFVPKNPLAKRTISMEQPQMNFWQNAVDKSIRLTKSMPRQIIDFRNQARSREMAVQASGDGRLATVDHSAASDMITADQVWLFFADVPQLRKWLFATRSTWTRYFPYGRSKGDTFFDCTQYAVDVPLGKFASMGSCCCFTVETLVFAAAACAACALTKPDWSYDDVRVYGDDVILPVWAYPRYLLICEYFGWKVNEDKSFASGSFREACGAFGWGGYDVTFPSASRTAVDFTKVYTQRDAIPWDECSAVVSLVNQLFAHGCEHARYYALQFLIRNRVVFMSRQPSLEELAEADIPHDTEHREQYPSVPLTVWSFSHEIGDVHFVDYHRALHFNTTVQFSEKRYTHGKPRRLLTTMTGRGVKASVPQNVKVREYSGGERLSVWLYRAHTENRRPLSPIFVSIGEEPIITEMCQFKRRQTVRAKRILLSP